MAPRPLTPALSPADRGEGDFFSEGDFLLGRQSELASGFVDGRRGSAAPARLSKIRGGHVGGRCGPRAPQRRLRASLRALRASFRFRFSFTRSTLRLGA
jgi:hypothetical protein